METVRCMFYWGGEIVQDHEEGITYNTEPKGLYMVPRRSTLSELVDMLVPKVAEIKESARIKLICRYPHQQVQSVIKYKRLPINDDETLNSVLDIPSWFLSLNCVEIYVVKDTTLMKAPLRMLLQPEPFTRLLTQESDTAALHSVVVPSTTPLPLLPCHHCHTPSLFPRKSIDIMDVSGSVVNAQSKKFCEEKNAENGDDKISNLPETLLSHILSFLPTKDAVRTSILSTRWKYMWTIITNLDFDDVELYSREGRFSKFHFMNFVERVLLHTGNSTIHSFSLLCSRDYDASRVCAWISAVISRKVTMLYIYYRERNFIFPHGLFSCNSLTKLNLTMRCTLNVLTSICFPNLKILQVSEVKFLNEHFSESEELLLSFPVLKVFDVTFCTWLNVKIINIDAPLLDSLTVGLHEYECALDGSHDCVMKICGPSLKKFKWYGFLSEDIILLNPSSICDATVIRYNRASDLNHLHEIGLRASMLLKQSSSVKYLTLSSSTIEILAHAETQATLPVFDKLTHLRLQDGVNFIVSRTFMDLLRSLPVLESVIFDAGISHRVKCDFVQEMVPQCFESCLKVVAFQKFYGKRPELDLVKFLLKNAIVLEEMIVTADEGRLGPKIDMEKFKRQILTFPKVSNCATIVFS